MKTKFITGIVGLICVFIIVALVILIGKEKMTESFYQSLKVQRSEMAMPMPGPLPLKKTESTLTSPPEFQYTKNPHSEFLEINPDYTGWLSVTGTRIDYPVVRGGDNAFYLNHDFEKKESRAGAIFMDYRNLGQFKDWHTVIYGHYMKVGTMFHDLHSFKALPSLTENETIVLEGLYDIKTYQIFSIYLVDANDFYLTIDVDSESRDALVNAMIEKSIVPSQFHMPSSFGLLTLATCTYEFDDARLIIHAFELPKNDE